MRKYIGLSNLLLLLSCTAQGAEDFFGLLNAVEAYHKQNVRQQFFQHLIAQDIPKAQRLTKKESKIFDALTYTKGLIVITQPNAPRTASSALVCTYLLEQKANPNCGALHNAGKYGHPQLCAPLVKARAMVDLRDIDITRETPLVKVDLRDLKRKTPLMYAIENRNVKTVTTLLRLKADPNALMPDERTTPFAYAFNTLSKLPCTAREEQEWKKILDELVAAEARFDLEDPPVSTLVEDGSEESESPTRPSACYGPTPYALTPSRLEPAQEPAPQ